LFLTPLFSHVPDNNQPRMNAHMDSKLETFVSLQTDIQVFQGIENTQPSSYRSLGVIFVCLGIPKVDKKTVT
jgi:hypothetical protein